MTRNIEQCWPRNGSQPLHSYGQGGAVSGLNIICEARERGDVERVMGAWSWVIVFQTERRSFRTYLRTDIPKLKQSGPGPGLVL
jgi:hypothetical protein